MIPLAITGGAAEGKSTVVGFLAHLGVSVLKADDIVSDLWKSSYVIESVSSALSISKDSSKETLRKIILEDSDARRAVNKIFHPLVWDRIASSGAFAIEVPLLIEACLHTRFERVWVVTCGAEEQHRRLMERMKNAALVASLMSCQLSTRVKLAFADEVIRTNSDLSSVENSVSCALSNYKGRN